MGVIDSFPDILLPRDHEFNDFRTIDSIHSRIHEGCHFVCVYTGSVSASSAISIAIVPTAATAQKVHFSCAVEADNAGVFTLYEGASISAGSALTATNSDRNSFVTSGAALTGKPVVTTTGTLLETHYIGTYTPTVKAGGLSEQSRVEYILTPGTTYLVKFTATTTALTSIIADYYVEGIT